MNGIERLKRQHEELLEAFDELELTGIAEERMRLFAHIGMRLKAHAAVEEEVFYPAVQRSGGARAAEVVVEAVDAHTAIDVLLDEILGSDVPADKVSVLRALAERHFAEEERALFPIVHQLDDAPRTRLATAIEDYLEEYGDGVSDALPAP